MTMMHRDRFPVKATSHTDRSAAPFGQGLTFWAAQYEHRDHSAADEDFYAAEFSGSEGWNPDDLAAMEEAARQAA